MQMDFYDPKVWTKHGLSPMTAKLLEGSSQERKEERHEAEQADDTAGDAGLAVPTMGTSAHNSAQAAAVDRNRRLSDSSATTTHTSSDEDVIASNKPRKAADPAQSASDRTILAYLTLTLAEVAAFREELSTLYDPAKKDAYPPLVVLSSRKTATVKGCVVNNEQEIMEGKYDRLLFGEGGELGIHPSLGRKRADLACMKTASFYTDQQLRYQKSGSRTLLPT